MTATVPPATLAAALDEITRLEGELAALRATAGLHAAILDHAPLLISTKDLEGNVLMANRYFNKLEGYEPGKFVGNNVFDLFPPDIAAQLWRNDQRAARERRVVTEEETVYHRDHSAHTYATVKFPLFDDSGEVYATCAVSTDITDTRLAQIDSITDALTGLKNRRYFNMLFMEEQRRAHREGRTLTLLVADIDCFKGYNDHYGHPQGDVVLRQVGATLSGALNRPGDLCFRIGGDEFACLFVTSVERESMELAERIRELLVQQAIAHEHNPGHGVVTMSLGLAFLRPDKEEALEHAYERADQALYRAKHGGRNRVER
ncbi:GGDEF domain-containing protein [Massilia sp. PAMC28688]|uniref:sensor domain-containing diguanylate cyclase n=1 Tax=Massilia sp. PAMC28688 TaxID=2861283 RepID=UPI001C639250|nr:GGDEF domain-containing protein [Massilia sp. PAMC28688]QYF92112.1 GGDEF domain-containing protein [Massilia sp. PAMC28688]